jgi:hypothetical protein
MTVPTVGVWCFFFLKKKPPPPPTFGTVIYGLVVGFGYLCGALGTCKQ